MEEKKETPVENQPKQLSYEDLKNIAGQLQQQNMQRADILRHRAQLRHDKDVLPGQGTGGR